MGGAMRFFRKRSKRTSTRQREKKLREHNRKVRKEKKKNPEKFKKSKKDPGVPNCPFREEVMQEIAEAKKRKEEERANRRQKLKLNKQHGKAGAHTESRAAAVPDFTFPEDELLAHLESGEQQEVFSFCDVDQLVGESDIIIEVLDARDPLSSQIAKVSKLCSDQNKRLIYLLNRADLVPKDVIKAWIKSLRMQHPAVAFKSSVGPSSKCIGHATLLSTLKSLNPRNENLSVGLVGYPAVGKRSVAKSLQENLSQKFSLKQAIGLALDGRKGSVYGKECLADLQNPCDLFSQYVFPRFPRTSWLMKYNQVDPGDTPKDLEKWFKNLGEQRVLEKYLKDYREGNLLYYARPSAGSKVKSTDDFGSDFDQLPDILEAESMELLPNPVLEKKRSEKELANYNVSDDDEDVEDESDDEEEIAGSTSGRGLKRKNAGSRPTGSKKKHRRA